MRFGICRTSSSDYWQQQTKAAEADSLSLGHTHSPAPMFDDDRHEPFFAAERTRTRTKIARGGRKKHLQKGGESGAKLTLSGGAAWPKRKKLPPAVAGGKWRTRLR